MAPLMTYIFSQEQHGHLTPYFAALHASCITQDRMIGPFLPPLTNEKLLPWWKERIAEANHGTRVIVLLLPEMAPGAKPMGTDLRGLAMLKLSEAETGSFRGHIDSVLVNQKFRRQGGAKLLVDALEYEAAKRGRTLLLADTETGSVAEAAFKRFGYTEVGKIPQFSRVLPNGTRGETFFYKNLLPKVA
ncbi:acetyltransferase [Rhypophila sp. PSN 637]